jgi:hypothetical protein
MSLRTEAKKTAPGSPFRAVGGKLEAPGLPAAGAAARLVGRIAKDRIGLVNLLEVPEGLDGKQTEVFLRENAAELCRDPRCSR